MYRPYRSLQERWRVDRQPRRQLRQTRCRLLHPPNVLEKGRPDISRQSQPRDDNSAFSVGRMCVDFQSCYFALGSFKLSELRVRLAETVTVGKVQRKISWLAGLAVIIMIQAGR